MGKSHQAGWVSLRGKCWYGYFRETVLDPETNEERVRKVPVRLGLKSQMNKLGARGALWAEITKRSGQIPERKVLKDSSVTFGWFVRNRYFPVRKGDWRPKTAITKMSQIEFDLTDKFGKHPLDSLDKFALQNAFDRLGGSLLPGSRKAGPIVSEVYLRRGHRAGVPGQGPDPQAEDSQESSG
jgi:hypothetical protein